MNVQCHACIGGTNIGEDIRKLDYGQHVVSGTPGRVFGELIWQLMSEQPFFFWDYITGFTILAIAWARGGFERADFKVDFCYKEWWKGWQLNYQYHSPTFKYCPDKKASYSLLAVQHSKYSRIDDKQPLNWVSRKSKHFSHRKGSLNSKILQFSGDLQVENTVKSKLLLVSLPFLWNDFVIPQKAWYQKRNTHRHKHRLGNLWLYIYFFQCA